MKQDLLCLGLITIFSLIGMGALFHNGLFTAHDIWHQVARFYYYSESFKQGYFPPYWISGLANGYGYPLFFFSYAAPWLIGLPLFSLGLSIPNVIMSLFIISFLFSGIFFYFLMQELFQDRRASLVGSLLYVWAPYHFLIILVGASMGVAFTFTFLPLVLLGLIYIKNRKLNKGILVFSVGLTGLILSHFLSIIICLPFFIIFTLGIFIQMRTLRGIRNFILLVFLSGFLALLLASFYVIPAYFYEQYTKFDTNPGLATLYQRNLLNFSQLVYSKWGYAPITTDASFGELSFQLGLGQWFSLIIVLFLFVTRRIKKEYLIFSAVLLVNFTICVFLITKQSSAYWDLLSKYLTIDFPFRLMLVLVMTSAISVGIAVKNLQGKKLTIYLCILVLLTIFSNRNHLKVNLYTEIPIENYLSVERTTNSFDEYLPEKAKNEVFTMDRKEVDNVEKIKAVTYGMNYLEVDYTASQSASVSLKQFDFPGQTVFLDNKIIPHTVDRFGLVNFESPQGDHKAAVKFQKTNLIIFAEKLTIAGILIWLCLLLVNFRRMRSA